MGKIVVLASGSGSNFQAIADAFSESSHEVAALIYDRKAAYAKERADKLGIEAHYVGYFKREREDAEKDMIDIIQKIDPDYIVLAGFMRLFTPLFVDSFKNKIVNIHPSLLPEYPGTDGIGDTYKSGDAQGGITIHFVDQGMDTGPVIEQHSIPRIEGESLDDFGNRIHALEHAKYPNAIISLLDQQQ